MGLAVNFLLTIFIELPIIALFFKRKKRQAAVLMALLINIISWSITNIIFFTADNINMAYVAIVLGIGEAIAFHRLLECNWKKAIIMSLIVNSLSFYATKMFPLEMFEPKPGVMKNTSQIIDQSR